jgi:N-dimethylarginine dimethylaminohydrolase
VPEEEDWAINGLAVRPGRLILSEGQPRTVERLVRRGVEVVEIPYREIQRGGGGIHCTTMELRRERAA